jgi:SurA N-terminal domain
VFRKPGRRTRAAAGGVAAASACVVLAACSPVKLGAAAIVGDQRITTSALDTQVSNLQTAAKPYGSEISLSAADMPAAVLSWLIRFQVSDQVAANAGISLSAAQVQAGIANINSQASSAASQDGLSSPQAALLDAGISPQMLPDLGRYQAQEVAFAEMANGGKLPTTTAEGNTVDAKLTKAQCTAAKSLNIQVSPQFGRLDYTQLSVVPTPNTLSQPPGTPSSPDTTGLTPAC